MNGKIHIMLKPEVAIRKVGKKNFIMSANEDYSKSVIPEISDKAVKICEYLKVERSFEDLKKNFDYFDEKTLNSFVLYLKNNNLAHIWDTSHKKRFISDIVSNEWSIDRTFYGCTFELTTKCNFRCVHCYLDDHHIPDYELPTTDIFKIIDKLYENGLMLIFYSGGDPFMRKDFKDIYVYTRKKGIMVEIFTNGSLINDEWLEIFKIYPPIEVDISLYGSNEEMYYAVTKERNMFDKVISNIEKMKKIGINVSLKCPIITILKDDLENMIELCKKISVPFRFDFIINPTIDNKSKANYQISFNEVAALTKKYSDGYNSLVEKYKRNCGNRIKDARKYFCSTGRCSGFIDYKGNLCPCIEMRDKGISLLENDFNVVWKHVKSFSYERIKENENYKCTSCRISSICKSCPAIRERINGSPTTITDGDCQYAQELLKTMIEGGDING